MKCSLVSSRYLHYWISIAIKMQWQQNVNKVKWSRWNGKWPLLIIASAMVMLRPVKKYCLLQKSQGLLVITLLTPGSTAVNIYYIWNVFWLVGYHIYYLHFHEKYVYQKHVRFAEAKWPWHLTCLCASAWCFLMYFCFKKLTEKIAILSYLLSVILWD